MASATKRVQSLMPTLTARQAVSIAKGALAYLLAFVFIFLHDFNKLNPYPLTLSGAVLVTIAGQPGRSVGACLDAGAFGLLGVLLGGAGFAILAKLAHAPVAQGFVFAIFVYFLALAKAQGLRFFGFSLLAIIMCFFGIYTSVLLGQRFDPQYLIAYLESYLWGFAIVLGVNLLVLPTTSERELREIICRSLSNVSFFAHLIAKTYRLELTDDERKVRDSLNLSIRADYGFLTQKLSETSLELNWSKWSMADYTRAVQHIRSMQQGLITSYSSLVVMEQYNPQALKFIKEQLSDSIVDRNFSKLRRGLDLVVDDIVHELAVSNVQYHLVTSEESTWQNFREDDESDTTLDVEQQNRGRSKSVVSTRDGAAVRYRLRKEVEGTTATPVGSRRPSPSRASDEKATSPSVHGKEQDPLGQLPKVSEIKAVDRPAFLRSCWASFEKSQNTAIADMLSKGLAGDELWLHRAGPSLHESFQQPAGARAWDTKSFLPDSQMSKRRPSAAVPLVVEPDAESERATDFVCGTAIMRTYLFSFGMGQVIASLADMHDLIVASQSGQERKKRLRLHLFERSTRSKEKTMCVKEAIAKLDGRTWHKPKVPFLARVRSFERLLRSSQSIYAFKVAAAVSVYTVFILAPSLKQFFVDYRLTGGLITIVVGLTMTTGSSIMTWSLQLLGTGFGSLYGMVLLYIFRNVGGYHFNPYGVVGLLVPFALALCWVIYMRPMFFAGALLAMNAAGTLIITEWVYREVPGQIRPNFDHPALSFAKALVALSVALALAFIFQIFLLRRPARRTLRKAIAQAAYSLASYAQVLTAYNEAILPAEEAHLSKPVPCQPEALKAVEKELIRREGIIQADLLGLMPIFKFASVEPDFGVKFDGPTILQVIRSHQVILDRLREARCALADQHFSQPVQKAFVEPLAPYRRQARKYNRVLFYLVATSLATKTPLPSDLPSMVTVSRSLQHDAMVLSHRFIKSLGPHTELSASTDSSFIRFWFFLVSFSSVAFQLERLEDLLRQLFTSDFIEAEDAENHETPPE